MIASLVVRSDRLSLLNEDLTLVQNISMATTNGTYVTSCLASQNTTDAAVGYSSVQSELCDLSSPYYTTPSPSPLTTSPYNHHHFHHHHPTSSPHHTHITSTSSPHHTHIITPSPPHHHPITPTSSPHHITPSPPHHTPRVLCAGTSFVSSAPPLPTPPNWWCVGVRQLVLPPAGQLV